MKNSIITEFNNSLVINTSDLMQDYMEIGIDSLFENELAKQIPIIKTFVGIAKVGKDLSERNFTKNLIIFLNELNTGTIDREKLRNHQEKLNNDIKLAEKELGRILIILNQVIDNEKSYYLSKLYKAYVNEIINWDLFCEYSEMLNRLFIQDLNVLKQVNVGDLSVTSGHPEMFRIERLNSIGIIGLTPKTIMIGNNNSRMDSFITLNKNGRLFASIIFN